MNCSYLAWYFTDSGIQDMRGKATIATHEPSMTVMSVPPSPNPQPCLSALASPDLWDSERALRNRFFYPACVGFH